MAASPVYSARSLNFSPRDTASATPVPTVLSPTLSVLNIAHSQDTFFTGQSPALVNPPLPIPPQRSGSTISDPAHYTQPPRRYRQDEEERTVAALYAAEGSLGSEHPHTLSLRTRLGDILFSQGRYRSAEEVARRIVEDCRKYEINGLVMLDGMRLLSSVLLAQGSFHQSYSLQKWVFESSKATVGEEHPFTLKVMTELALGHSTNGHLEEAEELCVRALEISKRTLGRSHWITNRGMSVLLDIYRKQGRLKEAETLGVQTLEFAKTIFGNKDAEIIGNMDTLAAVYSQQGRFKKAEEVSMQLLDVLVHLYGEEHPLTLDCRHHLATTYTNQRRFKEAEDLGVQVLVARRRVLGERHPDTIDTMDLLIKTYEHQGQLFKAEELKKQKLELQGE